MKFKGVIVGGTGLSSIETTRRAEEAVRRADLYEGAARAAATLPVKAVKILNPKAVPEEFLGQIMDDTNKVVYAHYIVRDKDFGEAERILRSGILTRGHQDTDFGVKHLVGKDGHIELKLRGDMRAIAVCITTEGPGGLPLYIFKKYVSHARITGLTINKDKPIDISRLKPLTDVSSIQKPSGSGGASAASVAHSVSAADSLRERRPHLLSSKLSSQVDSLMAASSLVEQFDKEGVLYFRSKFDSRIDGASILHTIENIHAHPDIRSLELPARTTLLKLSSILVEYYERDYLRSFLIAIYDSFDHKPTLVGSALRIIHVRTRDLERQTRDQALHARTITAIREFSAVEFTSRTGIYSQWAEALEVLKPEMIASGSEAMRARVNAKLNSLHDSIRIEVSRDELQPLLQGIGVSAPGSIRLAKLTANPNDVFYGTLRVQEKAFLDTIIYGGSSSSFEFMWVCICRDVLMHRYLLHSMLSYGFADYYNMRGIYLFLHTVLGYAFMIPNLWIIFRFSKLLPYAVKDRYTIFVIYNALLNLGLAQLIHIQQSGYIASFLLPFMFHAVYTIGSQKYLGQQIDFTLALASSGLHALRVASPLFVYVLALKVMPPYPYIPGVSSLLAYIVLPLVVGAISFKWVFMPLALSVGFLFGASLIRLTSTRITSTEAAMSMIADASQRLDNVKPLSAAIEEGDKRLINSLISSGVDMHYEDAYDNTPLMIAIKKRNLWLVQRLLDARINVNQVNKNGITALILAAQNGDEDIVKKLIKHGADVNHAMPDGVTALMLAVKYRYVHMVKKGIIDGSVELALASKDKDDSIVDNLLKSGIDLEKKDGMGTTVLFLAIKGDHDSFTQKLISAGSNIHHVNNHGDSALMVACQYDSESTISILIGAGTKLDLSNKDGDTPLIVSARKNHAGMVHHLLNAGASINVQNNLGNTAVMEAARSGHDFVLDQLINARADVRITNGAGDTALIVSAHGAPGSTIERLINVGSDIRHTNNDGLSAVRFASCQNPDPTVAALLISAGAVLDDQSLECMQARGWEFTHHS